MLCSPGILTAALAVAVPPSVVLFHILQDLTQPGPMLTSTLQKSNTLTLKLYHKTPAAVTVSNATAAAMRRYAHAQQQQQIGQQQQQQWFQVAGGRGGLPVVAAAAAARTADPSADAAAPSAGSANGSGAIPAAAAGGGRLDELALMCVRQRLAALVAWRDAAARAGGLQATDWCLVERWTDLLFFSLICTLFLFLSLPVYLTPSFRQLPLPCICPTAAMHMHTYCCCHAHAHAPSQMTRALNSSCQMLRCWSWWASRPAQPSSCCQWWRDTPPASTQQCSTCQQHHTGRCQQQSGRAQSS